MSRAGHTITGRAWVLLGVIYLGYISLGLPDGTLGVAWPEMYPELKLPIGLAGATTTMATLLSGLSGFANGWVIRHFRTGPTMLASAILTSSGLFALSRVGGAVGLFLVMIPLGIGAGAVDAGLNGYVARHYHGRHMNWLHACWGIGATSGPLIIGAALAAGHGWRGGYVLLASMQASLALLFLLTLGLWSAVPERTEAAHAADGGKPPTLGADSAEGWSSAAIFALYVAVEAITGVWAGSVMVVGRGIDATTTATCVAGFFGAITAGRIAAGLAVERLGNRRLVWMGGALALVGLTAFIWAGSAGAAATALIITGLGLAPIYPCLMHEVPRRFAPEAVQTVIGRQSGAGALGAATFPALAGWVAQHQLGMVPWLAVAAHFALFACIWRLDRRT